MSWKTHPASKTILPGRFARRIKQFGKEGGDFCITWKTRGGRVVLLGDVQGKGHAAALVVRLVKKVVTMLLATTKPAALMSELNDELIRRLGPGGHDPDLFVSAVLIIVRWGRPQITVFSAGHHAPVLVSAGRVHQVLQHPGFPLGLEKTSYEGVTIDVPPGSVLLLYTDGLFDVRNAARERLGEERLLRMFARCDPSASASANVRSVIRRVRSFGKPTDDMAMAAIRWPAPTADGRHPTARRSRRSCGGRNVGSAAAGV